MYTLGTAANKTTANKVREKNILIFAFNVSNIHTNGHKTHFSVKSLGLF